ncbi:MAG: CHRD domain-containing protein [Chloroflexota bacterium]|nr:CHRD domain-containing protein [Chloroflexota bacterium]
MTPQSFITRKLYRFLLLMLPLFATLLLVFASVLQAQEHQGADEELQRESPIALNPAAGAEVGFVYEAYLSPHQEGGEEDETPAVVPPELRSTEPSVPRNQRTSRGHAAIEFTHDLSRAYVYLAVENVAAEDVVMLHLHCGRPGQLGPILVDFALIGSINEFLADGVMRVEVTNEDLVATTAHGEGPLAFFTVGCPIIAAVPTDRVRTIAGMEVIAREGELYFNLHTKAQTFFGDIRGQFYLVGG